MADKQAFLQQLTDLAGEVQADVTRLDATIRSHEQEIAGWRVQRTRLISGHAERLLPDLNELTLAALAREVPYFMSKRAVDDEVLRAGQSHQLQLTNLLRSFRPQTYERKKVELESEVARAETDLDSAREPFGDLTVDRDLEHLNVVSYETPDYLLRWYNLEFYRDWKCADAAVARYGAKDWAELKKHYDGMVLLKESLAEARAKLAKLNDAYELHEELTTTLAAVPARVRDQLQIKFKAWIDTQSRLPESMADIADLNKQIAERQKTVTELHTAKASLTTQLTKLRGVQTKAARSKRRDVPDQYMAAFRSRGPSRAYDGGTGAVFVHTHQQYTYFDDTQYAGVAVYFDDPAPSRSSYGGGSGHSGGGGSSGSYSSTPAVDRDPDYGGTPAAVRSRAYDDARADTSGSS